MLNWQGKRTIAVVSACMNACGVPDFAFTEVEVTQDEYDNGVHYDLVQDRLTDDKYDEPFVHFDEIESPTFLHPAVKEYLQVGKEANTEDADAPDFV